MADSSRPAPDSNAPTRLAELTAEVETLGHVIEDLRTRLNEATHALALVRAELAPLQTSSRAPVLSPTRAWKKWLSPSMVVAFLYILGLLLGVAALASGFIKLH